MFLRYPDFFTQEESQQVYNLVLDMEPELKILAERTAVQRDFYSGITNLYKHYNFLPIIKSELNIDIAEKVFKLDIFEEFDDLWIQCWCNVWRQGEGITMHQHGTDDLYWTGHNDFYVSHIFLGGDVRTGTYYGEFNENIESRVGEMHLIGAMDKHKVNLNLYQQPRISMAMDIWWNLPHQNGQYPIMMSDFKSPKEWLHARAQEQEEGKPQSYRWTGYHVTRST